MQESKIILILFSLLFMTNCLLVTQFKNADQTTLLKDSKKWEIYSPTHLHSLYRQTNNTNETDMKENCVGAKSVIYSWGETNVLVLSNLDLEVNFNNNLESIDVLFNLNGIGTDKGLTLDHLFLSYPPKSIKIDVFPKDLIKGNSEYEISLSSPSSSSELKKIENTKNLSVSLHFTTEGTDAEFEISCIKLKLKSSDIRIDDDTKDKEGKTQIEDTSSFPNPSSSNIPPSSVIENEDGKKNGTFSSTESAVFISFFLYFCLLMTMVLTYIGIKKRMVSSKGKKKNKKSRTGINCETHMTSKHELYRSLKSKENIIQGVNCIFKHRIDKDGIIKKEFEILKKFKNENNIVKVVSFLKPLLERPAGYYMEYTPLGNLYSFIYDNKKTEIEIENSNMNFETKISFFLDLCRGLEILHREGVIHTNIIPSNVLVFPNTQGKKCMYKLKFCGFSKAIYENSSSEVDDSSLMFSLKYSPAEVFISRKYTKSSDVFSLMMMFYEIYEQKHPFYSLSDEDYKGKFINNFLSEPPSIEDKRLEKFNGAATQVFRMPPRYRNGIVYIRQICEDIQRKNLNLNPNLNLNLNDK